MLEKAFRVVGGREPVLPSHSTGGRRALRRIPVVQRGATARVNEDERGFLGVLTDVLHGMVSKKVWVERFVFPVNKKGAVSAAPFLERSTGRKLQAFPEIFELRPGRAPRLGWIPGHI